MGAPHTTEHRPYEDLGIYDLLLRKSIFEAMESGKVHKHVLPFIEKVMDNKAGIGKIFTNDQVKKISAFIFKHTAFKVFFGGLGMEECTDKCIKLSKKGVGVIVDFAGKEKLDNPTEADLNEVIDKYNQSILICRQVKTALEESDIKPEIAAAFKFSTIAPMEELKEVSKWINEGKDFNNKEMSQKYEDIRTRAAKVFTHAREHNIEVYADAEQSYINPVINDICKDLMGRGLTPTFTVQAYLKNSPQLVEELLNMNPPPNIKLVRGAYIDPNRDKRRALAAEKDEATALETFRINHSLELDDEIWDTKEETDKNYNDLLVKIYESGKVEKLTVASHNDYSRKLAQHLKQETPNDTKIIFSTLLGMGKNLEAVDKALGCETDYTPVVLIDEKSTALEKAEAVLGCVAYFVRRSGEFMGDLKDGTDRTRAQVELGEINKELVRKVGVHSTGALSAIVSATNKIAFTLVKGLNSILTPQTARA